MEVPWIHVRQQDSPGRPGDSRQPYAGHPTFGPTRSIRTGGPVPSFRPLISRRGTTGIVSAWPHSSFRRTQGADDLRLHPATHACSGIVTGQMIPLDSLLGAPAFTDVSLPYLVARRGAQYLLTTSDLEGGPVRPRRLGGEEHPDRLLLHDPIRPRFGGWPLAGGPLPEHGPLRLQALQDVRLPPRRAAARSSAPFPPVECQSAYVTTSTAGPYGPFSTPTPLAKFPQMDPGNAASMPDILCYGVAEQPRLRDSRSLADPPDLQHEFQCGHGAGVEPAAKLPEYLQQPDGPVLHDLLPVRRSPSGPHGGHEGPREP